MKALPAFTLSLLLASSLSASIRNAELTVEVGLWGSGGSYFEAEIDGQHFNGGGAYQMTHFEVGTEYEINFTGVTTGAQFSFIAPGGYRVLINGIPKSRAVLKNSTDATRHVVVLPVDYTAPAGAFEYDENLRNIIWRFGLGSQSNGVSAGMLEIREPNEDSQAVVLNRANLAYVVPDSPEIDVVLDGTGVRQILTRWVLVDIVDNGGGYDISFYDIAEKFASAGSHYSNGRYIPSGSFGPRFAKYEIRPGSMGDAQKTRLKIKEIRGDASNNVSTTRHFYYSDTAWSYAPGWVFRDDDGLSVSKTFLYEEEWYKQQSVAIMEQATTSSTEYWAETYEHFFSKFLDDKLTSSHADHLNQSYATRYEWYMPFAGEGSRGQVRLITHPDGNWEHYSYHTGFSTAELAAGHVLGLPKSVSRPFKDEVPDIGNGIQTEYLYASATAIGADAVSDDPSRTRDFPYKIKRKRGAKVIGETRYQYVTKSGGNRLMLNGKEYTTRIERAYADGSTALVTTRKTYDYDLETNPSSSHDAFFRNQPVSVEQPDGRKDSYLAWTQSLSYNASSQTLSRGAGGQPSNTGWEVTVFHGTSAGSAPGAVWVGSWYGGYIDGLYLIPHVSTVDVLVRDAPYTLKETYVFTGNGGGSPQFELLSWTYEKHAAGGELLWRRSSNGTSYAAELKHNRLKRATLEDGSEVYYLGSS